MKISGIKSSVFLFLIFLSVGFYSSSQNLSEYGCGTVSTPESLEFYNSLKPQVKKNETRFMSKSSFSKDASGIKTNHVPIKAHIIRSSQGTDGLSIDDLNAAIYNLNAIFADAYLNFSLSADINYIDEDVFFHFNRSNEAELTKNSYSEGFLNIYFVKYLENESESSICGYANITQNSNVILMKNSCVTNDSSLPHEIGHFLSLMHTQGPNNNSTELVDGSNCDTDGDGICDTPADPTLTASNVNNYCEYIGSATDANGDTYHPDTRNIMSYSYKGCRTHFSSQQLTRMYAFYKAAKDLFFGAESIENKDATDKNLEEVSIYPNPTTNGVLNLHANSLDGSIQYEISNLYGQIYSKGVLNHSEININRLASGTYLLVLKDSHSQVVKKFIK